MLGINELNLFQEDKCNVNTDSIERASSNGRHESRLNFEISRLNDRSQNDAIKFNKLQHFPDKFSNLIIKNLDCEKQTRKKKRKWR